MRASVPWVQTDTRHRGSEQTVGERVLAEGIRGTGGRGTTRILIESENVKASADLHSVEVTSNKRMLHCKGGTVIHIWDDDTSVTLTLSDDTFEKLRKEMNLVYEYDHISERAEEEE